MVANAGIIVPKRLFDVSLEEWNKVQSVSFTLAFSDSKLITLVGERYRCLPMLS